MCTCLYVRGRRVCGCIEFLIMVEGEREKKMFFPGWAMTQSDLYGPLRVPKEDLKCKWAVFWVWS